MGLAACGGTTAASPTATHGGTGSAPTYCADVVALRSFLQSSDTGSISPSDVQSAIPAKAARFTADANFIISPGDLQDATPLSGTDQATVTALQSVAAALQQWETGLAHSDGTAIADGEGAVNSALGNLSC